MAYMVLDVEVENRTIRKRFSSPWHPDNYIVARGWKVQGDTQCRWEYFQDAKTSRNSVLVIPDNVDLLVGLNIKFDLLWEMQQNGDVLRAFFKRGGRIWDCQYAEYLIEGQHPDFQMVSMDQPVFTVTFMQRCTMLLASDEPQPRQIEILSAA